MAIDSKYIQDLLKGIANKVTVDMKSSGNMGEIDVFKMMNSDDPFKYFPEIFSQFKNMPSGSTVNYNQQRNMITREKPKPQQQTAKLDHLMYIFACEVDKTLTLFSEKDAIPKVETFKKALHDNLTNSKDAFKKFKLKMRYKMTLDEVIQSLTLNRGDDVEPLLAYMCNILQTNLVHKDKNNRIVTATFDGTCSKYSLVQQNTDDTYTIEVNQVEPPFQIIVMNKFGENLKKLLTKDLKQLAIELSLETTKTITSEEGKEKKIQLLKEDLIQKISDVIKSTHINNTCINIKNGDNEGHVPSNLESGK